jgi:hypothetical protein
VVVGGYQPTWTADGKGIVFHRGTPVLRYDVASAEERLILDVAEALPGVDEFGAVERSPDDRRLALPLRGRFAGVFGLQGPISGAAVYASPSSGWKPAATVGLAA